MKARNIALLATASALLLAAGYAGAQADALKAKGCLNCHDTDKKKVGPSLKDIAAKSAGKSDELTTKLKEGKGHPKVSGSDAEIKAAVDQALSTK